MDKVNSKFNVLILSAGSGSRMGSIGRSIPKSMLRINKREILDYLIEKLNLNGISKINITVGFKKKKIINFLKIKNIKYNAINVMNYNKCGSIYSWYKSKKIIENKKNYFLLIHSDLLFHKTYLEKIINHKKQNIISSTNFRKQYTNKKSWMVYYDKFSNLLKLNKKDKNHKCSQVACINKFSLSFMKEFFKYMEQYFKLYGIEDTWEIVLNKFSQERKKKVHVIKNNKFWFNLNSQKDYASAKKFLTR